MILSNSGEHHLDISKELEAINFRVLRANKVNNGSDDKSANRAWIKEANSKKSKKYKINDQFTLFQKAMRLLIIWGQCIGLNPVMGILQNDSTKMRFTVYSWKFIFAIILATSQIGGAILCLCRLIKTPEVQSGLSFVTFYMNASCVTVIFIRIASQWPTLMKELIDSKLDDYVCHDIVKRCNVACGVFMGMSLMEHVMSVTSTVTRIVECFSNVTDMGEAFVQISTPWFYELSVSHAKVLEVVVQYLNLVVTATWNYTDVFIVCISLYLTSVLEQINKKITYTANKKYVSASTWAIIREDYTRATNLVKLFDDAFSGVVVVTFANDLFFICIQLYNVLSKAIDAGHIEQLCPEKDDGIFRVYLYPAYVTYSTAFLCLRFLTVALVAAGVNTASMVPGPVLYRVPSTSYSKEVERFQNQVNSDKVALSGLHFFYITRDTVLTVAGTIVTYELVLLQFGNGGS